MRQFMIAGNWKMHGSRASATALLEALSLGARGLLHRVDIVVFPSFVHLALCDSILKASSIEWGAQNVYLGESGAYTGEVSGPMLTDFNCRYVLVGHSERRQLFQESMKIVAAKLKAALAAGLTPILCLGETLAEREADLTQQVIEEQLQTAIVGLSSEALQKVIIAYEPVWAIGTGLTATPEQADAVHGFIRQQIAQRELALGKTTRILYGGSVKADNAAGLFKMPNIDGALVGGASLEAASFLKICEAAVSIGQKIDN